jgi:hypothetical protein
MLRVMASKPAISAAIRLGGGGNSVSLLVFIITNLPMLAEKLPKIFVGAGCVLSTHTNYWDFSSTQSLIEQLRYFTIAARTAVKAGK